MAIIVFAGVPILLAVRPEWLAWLHEQLPTRAASDLPSVNKLGIVKRFNSSADGQRMLLLARSGAGINCLGLVDVNQPDDWMPIDVMGEPIGTATLSPDGLHALIGTLYGGLAWIDMETGTTLMLRESSELAPMTATAISNDLRHFAAASCKGWVCLYKRQDLTSIALLPCSEACAIDLRFSHDGERLVAARTNGSVVVWDCATGKPLQSLSAHRGPVTAALMVPDGKQIISAGYDGEVRIWNTGVGGEARRIKNAGPAIQALALSANGTTAAWGTVDGTICIWNLACERSEKEFNSLGAAVRHLEFSSDGRVLAVAGCEGAIRRFEVATGVELPGIDVGRTGYW